MSEIECFKAYGNANYGQATDEEFDQILRADTQLIHYGYTNGELRDSWLPGQRPEIYEAGTLPAPASARAIAQVAWNQTGLSIEDKASLPPKQIEANANANEMAGGENSSQAGSAPIAAQAKARRLWPWVAAFALFVVIGLILGLSLLHRQSEALLAQVPDEDAAALREVLELRPMETLSSAKIVRIPESGRGVSLLIAVNAARTADLSLHVQGVPKTLVGHYQFESRIPLKWNDSHPRLFEVRDIRDVDGSFLPVGEYLISLECPNCGAQPITAMATTRMSVGMSPQDAQYKMDLARFHEQARKRAQIELNELTQIHQALLQQLNQSSAKFSKLLKLKDASVRVRNWQTFSQSWTHLHGQILDAFTNLDDAEFLRALFYGKIYQDLRGVAEQIKNLHGRQGEKLVWVGRDSKLDQDVSSYEQTANEGVEKTDRSIELMRSLLVSSKGFPPREGLSNEE